MGIKNIALFIVLLAVAGCSSAQAIYDNYAKIVNVSDGVNEEEAKIMAQKQIIGTQEQRDYRVTAPDIKNTPQAQKYPEYWFIVFGHNWFSPVSTDPLAKTYTELRETQYLVVINKKTGEIKFAGEWYPKRANDFDWVFGPGASYRKDNSLSLPPGEKSTPVNLSTP